MSELKWNWADYPYLDPPEKQKESALKAGYIKVVDKDESDFEKVKIPIRHAPGYKLLRQFEKELLRFADRFKTRRVYCVFITKDRSRDGLFQLDRYYKFFTFDDRSLAFGLARYHHGRVQIYNFASLINQSLELVEHVPSPNRYEAIELWKTFNTCDICHSKSPCTDVRVRGSLGRVCKSCIDKYCRFTIKGKPISFKESSDRHFKVVKDTTYKIDYFVRI